MWEGLDEGQPSFDQVSGCLKSLEFEVLSDMRLCDEAFFGEMFMVVVVWVWTPVTAIESRRVWCLFFFHGL